MAARRIVMRPMHESALFIPNILSGETDRVADIQRFDARGEISIVFDQYRLARLEPDDKPLMRPARSVVRKNARYDTFIFDLDFVFMLLEGLGDRGSSARS